MHVNRVTLIGHLGADPEMKVCANNALLFKMRVCTDEEWHSVDFFAKSDAQADFLKERLTKGTLVYVEGEIATDRWTEGNTRRIWKKIKASRIDPLRESLRALNTLEADGVPADFNPDEPTEEPSPRYPAPVTPLQAAPQPPAPRRGYERPHAPVREEPRSIAPAHGASATARTPPPPPNNQGDSFSGLERW